jgi:hypothetical protein
MKLSDTWLNHPVSVAEFEMIVKKENFKIDDMIKYYVRN